MNNTALLEPVRVPNAVKKNDSARLCAEQTSVIDRIDEYRFGSNKE